MAQAARSWHACMGTAMKEAVEDRGNKPARSSGSMACVHGYSHEGGS